MGDRTSELINTHSIGYHQATRPGNSHYKFITMIHDQQDNFKTKDINTSKTKPIIQKIFYLQLNKRSI